MFHRLPAAQATLKYSKNNENMCQKDQIQVVDKIIFLIYIIIMTKENMNNTLVSGYTGIETTAKNVNY